ncbi:Dual oxidase maturation factor 1-like protein [Dinothrombium tinctorium]|uniref:Dual oxidase maturation factor 1-like protein n=1 Tax=Dinothrombium tinctorium TaxID=1965070 RepID=A0A3S3SDM9_9ACAR|nr:Dual oxidase maturation factor 1-like protein [Dinothrombium tinctorium]RWS13900.1 Dual oxidase maturation factor 1-like protein [Dinothrombium tinctorium]
MEAYKEVRKTSFFQAFRSEGFPTNYGENHVPAEADVFTVTIIILFVGIAIAFLIILPGFRGKERVYVLLRTVISLGIGVCIALCNFGHKWEYASVSVTVPYKAGLGANIKADLQLKLGLRGFNVTLKDQANKRPLELKHEIINYNEHFSWEWEQGRFGFGAEAGRIQREYKAAKDRGVPLPIMSIAEYFTIDGDGIRFGRFYRLAGWYTHILMWLAFALWLLMNIVFQLVIQYGALLLILTGKVLIIANILYCNIRNPIPLEIPFESIDGKSTVWLKPTFSWCYYLNLANGIVCVLLGLIAFYADLRYPDEIAEFFGVDVLSGYEEVVEDFEEEEKPAKETSEKIYAPMTTNVTYVGLRKRTPSMFASRLSRLQRSTIRGASMLHHKPDNVNVSSPPNVQHSMLPEGLQKEDIEAGFASLRRKVRPEAPVYQNFIRESFAPVEEEPAESS